MDKLIIMKLRNIIEELEEKYLSLMVEQNRNNNVLCGKEIEKRMVNSDNKKLDEKLTELYSERAEVIKIKNQLDFEKKEGIKKLIFSEILAVILIAIFSILAFDTVKMAIIMGLMGSLVSIVGLAPFCFDKCLDIKEYLRHHNLDEIELSIMKEASNLSYGKEKEVLLNQEIKNLKSKQKNIKSEINNVLTELNKINMHLDGNKELKEKVDSPYVPNVILEKKQTNSFQKTKK